MVGKTLALDNKTGLMRCDITQSTKQLPRKLSRGAQSSHFAVAIKLTIFKRNLPNRIPYLINNNGSHRLFPLLLPLRIFRAFSSVTLFFRFLFPSIQRTDRVLPPIICVMIDMIVMRAFMTTHKT